MDVAGSFVVEAPREAVWTLIRDPEVVARCVPGCSSIEPLGPTSYRAAVKIGLGPLKMTFNVVVDVVEEIEPESILSTTSGEEGGRASFVSSKNRLALAALDDERTEVSYASTVSVTGRLGKFGLGMMRKKADSVAAEFGRAFGEVARTAAATVATPP